MFERNEVKRFVTICLMLILVVSINPIGYAQTAAEIEFWQSVKDGDDIDSHVKPTIGGLPDFFRRSPGLDI